MENYLKSSAASYDFGKGFFQPTRAQMLDSSPGQNFGIMASATLRQQMRVRNRPEGKFDAVSYFLHFFLGMASSVQQSKKLRENFNIDKIFYRIENDHTLKMLVLTKQEDSSGKLMTKYINFGENKPSDWSDKDFIEIVSKVGQNIKSYQFESHHYHVDFIKDAETTSNDDNELLSFFIETNYDLTMKIKPSHIKAGQRKVEPRFQEIISVPQKQNIMYMEDFFGGMLSNTAKPTQIKQFVKDFSNQVINDFKKFSKTPQSSTAANAGYMHGYMFPFQKKFNFIPEVIQLVSDETHAQFYVNVQKKFSSDWKQILHDYPFKFHIIDISSDMDRSSIERRVLEVMVQSQTKEQPSIDFSLSDKILVTYLNFNAPTRTVAQNEVKVTAPAVYELVLSLTGVAQYIKLENFRGKEDMALKSASDFLSRKFRDEILLKSLETHNLCSKDSRCLSRFIHGLLSSGNYKAHTVRPKDETDFEKEHVTNFVFETEVPDIHALVTLHEDASFSDDFIKNVESNQRKVPHLSKKSKYIVHFNIFASYDPVDVKFKTQLKPVEFNSDYRIEIISQIDFRPKANPALDAAVQMSQFLKSKINLFRNYNDLAAFAVGMFYDLRSLTNVVRPGPNTMQQAYVVQNKRGDQLVLVNFIFGKDKEVSNDFKVISRLIDETISRKMSDAVRIVCFTVIEDSETRAQKASFLTEKDLLLLKACKKSRRKRRTFCGEEEPILEQETDPAMQVSEKIDMVTKLGKISSGVMTGMMVKSLIADMMQGNMAGVAINAGFILSNLLAHAGSMRMAAKGAELTKGGRLLSGTMLKSGASFLVRTPSVLFIGYDLYTNLHTNDSSTENKVAIGTDTAYLAIDISETAIELAEAFEVIGGVSSATGPIGLAIGATLVVGSDLYRAVKQVERIDAIIPLTPMEKVVQGLRGFIGLKPSSSISNLISAEQWNTKNIQQTLDMLSEHKSIYRIVVPAKTVEDCHAGKRMNFTAPKQWVQPTRTLPKLQNGFSYFCITPFYCERPKFSDFLTILFTSKVRTHSCLSAVGIQNWKAESTNHTYYQLADGDDTVVAFKNEFNTFYIGNGRKIIRGGDKDDIFLLSGNHTYGQLDGGSGKNLLNAANVELNATFILKKFHFYSLGNKAYENIALQVYDFHQFHGRTNQRDLIVPWCGMDKIDTLGGSEHGVDYILIPSDSNCMRHLSINIHPYTYVVNEALSGIFNYHVENFGASTINIRQKTDATTHVFTFNYSFFDISAVWTRWKKTMKKIIFITDDSTKFYVKSPSWENVKFAFKDGVNFHFQDEHVTAVLNTTDELESKEDAYASVIAASTISMVIHNNDRNETVVISGGRHQRGDAGSVHILHSSPDHKTRLRGNGKQENVYTIVPYRDPKSTCLKFHDVFVTATSNKTLIDLTKIRNLAVTENMDIKMKLLAINLNITIIEVIHNIEFERCGYKIGTLTVDHSDSRENIIILADGPLKLKFRDSNPHLESVPLHFSKFQNVVILSEHNINPNTKIVIDKQLGKNRMSYVHNRTLIFSNMPIEDDNSPCDWMNYVSRDSIAIIMVDYFASDTMQNLVFKFKDVELKSNMILTLKAAEIKEYLVKFEMRKCICHSIMKLPLPNE